MKPYRLTKTVITSPRKRKRAKNTKTRNQSSWHPCPKFTVLEQLPHLLGALEVDLLEQLLERRRQRARAAESHRAPVRLRGAPAGGHSAGGARVVGGAHVRRTCASVALTPTAARNRFPRARFCRATLPRGGAGVYATPPVTNS